MRMEDASDDELWQAMDDELIYTEDRWTLLKGYCTPEEADFGRAWEDFYCDLSSALADGVLEDEEEEEDE